jgi:hypothetical protein
MQDRTSYQVLVNRENEAYANWQTAVNRLRMARHEQHLAEMNELAQHDAYINASIAVDEREQLAQQA